MQKKIVTLAVASLVTGAVFAQSNVTVYGIIDQGYWYSSSNTAPGSASGKSKFSGLKDGSLNGSRLGFKGEESLGNGLKTVFTLELGKDADNDGAFSNRQSWVGLSSNNWGTLTLGRSYNVASSAYGRNDANEVTGVNPLNLLKGQFESQITTQGGNARQSNNVRYFSPKWDGFSFGANYAFGETTSGTSSSASSMPKVTDNGRYSAIGS